MSADRPPLGPVPVAALQGEERMRAARRVMASLHRSFGRELDEVTMGRFALAALDAVDAVHGEGDPLISEPQSEGSVEQADWSDLAQKVAEWNVKVTDERGEFRNAVQRYRLLVDFMVEVFGAARFTGTAEWVRRELR